MATLQDLLDQRTELEDQIAECLRAGELEPLYTELAQLNAAITQLQEALPTLCCT